MATRPIWARSRLELIAMVSLLALGGAARAADFSADFTEKTGPVAKSGKVYVKGLKVMREETQGRQRHATIIRMDKKLVWILNPADKTYMEIAGAGKEAAAMSSDPKALAALKRLGERKRVGTETVNGYVCDKYAFIYRDKSMGTQYQWVSTRLKVPIRIEHKSPRFSMLIEYKNIKEGKVADSIFEIPKGYRKVSVPGLGGMRGMPGMPGRPK